MTHSSRTVAAVLMTAVLGAALFAFGLGAEIHNAVQRVDDISISYVSSSPPVTVTDRARRQRDRILYSALWSSLHRSQPPQRWTINTTTHLITLEAGFPEDSPYLLGPYSWAPSGTVIPMAGGLALMLGALFVAAAAWRPAPSHTKREP